MKILYLTLSKIDLQKQGIYADLINALRDAGHEVMLVQACEPKDTKETFISEEGGVRILRVLVGSLFGVNFIQKGINTVLIAPKCKAAIRKFLGTDRFDLVLYATPPITFAGVVRFAKKRYGCKSFLMLKDIFPQNAVDIGLFSDRSPICAYFRHQEKVLYDISDHIGCMSKKNREYLLAHHPELHENKVLIFPNTQKITRREREEAQREANGSMRFVFGVNFGRPHAIDFLIRAIEDSRKQDLNASFVFVGNGSEVSRVEQAAAKLPNMEFVPFMPPEEYEQFMESCDVGIISLDYRFTIPNYPSRALGYMAMEKPILAATDPVTDIRELVTQEAKCGLWCSSDDVDGFIDCVRRFLDDPAFCRTCGTNGRKYLEAHFDVQTSVAKIEESMKG